MLIIIRFENSNNMLCRNCCYDLTELNCFICGKICFSYFALHAMTMREIDDMHPVRKEPFNIRGVWVFSS